MITTAWYFYVLDGRSFKPIGPFASEDLCDIGRAEFLKIAIGVTDSMEMIVVDTVAPS